FPGCAVEACPFPGRGFSEQGRDACVKARCCSTPRALVAPHAHHTRPCLCRLRRGATTPAGPDRTGPSGRRCFVAASRPSRWLRLLLATEFQPLAGRSAVQLLRCVPVQCRLSPPRRPYVRFVFVGSELGLRLPPTPRGDAVAFGSWFPSPRNHREL